jgi:magnesium-transporting ATPase (P-type)
MFILGNIATANRLTKERPPKTLFSVANLTQLFVYSVLQLCGQLIAVLAIQGPFADSIDYYSHGGEAVNSARFISEGGDDYLFDSPESNVIFIVANFCYITSIVAFTTSEPWKTNAFKYWPYTLSIVLTLAYTICIAIVPQVRLSLFELVNMTDKDLNLFLLGVGLGIAMLIVLLQKCILIPLFKWIEEDKTES